MSRFECHSIIIVASFSLEKRIFGPISSNFSTPQFASKNMEKYGTSSASNQTKNKSTLHVHDVLTNATMSEYRGAKNNVTEITADTFKHFTNADKC